MMVGFLRMYRKERATCRACAGRAASSPGFLASTGAAHLRGPGGDPALTSGPRLGGQVSWLAFTKTLQCPLRN